jgi:hypothetical protein
MGMVNVGLLTGWRDVWRALDADEVEIVKALQRRRGLDAVAGGTQETNSREVVGGVVDVFGGVVVEGLVEFGVGAAFGWRGVRTARMRRRWR